MKLNFGTLWRFSGTINRGTYAAVGLFAFAIKHNLDCLVAMAFIVRGAFSITWRRPAT